MNDFGEFLYKLRKEKNMTQTELAGLLGVTNKAVSKWESGAAFPETAQLVPIANIFGVTVDELLKGRRAENREHSFGAQDVYTESNATVETTRGDNDDNDNDNDDDDYDYELDEEHRYVPTEKEKTLTAIGLVLILVGVFTFVIMSIINASYEIGMLVLFGSVAISVTLFIISDGIKKLNINSDTPELAEQLAKLNAVLAASVGVLILLPLAIIIPALKEMDYRIYLSIFFGIVLVCVIAIVLSGIKTDSINVQIKKISGNDKPQRKKTRVSDAITSIIMPLATCTYLILGFCFDLWHPGWVVFPIAAALSYFIRRVARAIRDTKASK